MSAIANLAVYILPWLVVMTLVITVHELGHFLTARGLGIAVDRFSIGFGRAIASWTDRWGVEWRIGMIPIGGYVRFRGDAEASSTVPDKDDLEDLRTQIVKLEGEEAVARYFHFRPIWQRALVVVAGPAANFILAVGLFAAILLGLGATVVAPKVGAVLAGSAAARAGFLPGDVIERMDGRVVEDFTDLSQYVMLRADQPIRFVVRRGAADVAITATPERKLQDDGLTGRTSRMGQLGLGAARGPATSITGATRRWKRWPAA